MKKIIYFITTILIIGIMNVQALTVGVSDNASLISALSNDTVSVVKLEGDFTYSGAAPQDVNKLQPNENKKLGEGLSNS